MGEKLSESFQNHFLLNISRLEKIFKYFPLKLKKKSKLKKKTPFSGISVANLLLRSALKKLAREDTLPPFYRHTFVAGYQKIHVIVVLVLPLGTMCS